MLPFDAFSFLFIFFFFSVSVSLILSFVCDESSFVHQTNRFSSGITGDKNKMKKKKRKQNPFISSISQWLLEFDWDNPKEKFWTNFIFVHCFSLLFSIWRNTVYWCLFCLCSVPLSISLSNCSSSSLLSFSFHFISFAQSFLCCWYWLSRYFVTSVRSFNKSALLQHSGKVDISNSMCSVSVFVIKYIFVCPV